MGALTAEQKELIEMTTRHKANNFLNEFRMEFQEHKTDVALMKQTIEFMQKDIGEIKQMTKDFISSADSKYATQEQHLQNKIAIDKINKIFLWIGGIVGATIVGAILKLILK